MRGRRHLVTVVVAVAVSAAAWGATSLFWDEADYRRPPDRAHVTPPEELSPTPTPTCPPDEAEAEEGEAHEGMCFVFYFTAPSEP
jgi:hypothetical protein